VPNSVLRVLIVISALVAALLIAGVGAGSAGAEPDGTGGDGTGTGTGTGTGEPSDPPPVTQPVVVEPAPTTTTPPSIFDIPRNIANQLRDMMGRPLSIFGNGRTPGTHTLPDGTASDGGPVTRKRDKAPVEKVAPAAPDPVTAVSAQETPTRKQVGTSADETPTSSDPPVSSPVPNDPNSGYDGLRWRLNLSDPFAILTSVGQTLNTVNSLLADAYAPYNPFKPPPPPEPEPTFRIMQEAPEAPVDVGGEIDVTPMANDSDLPVVQAPVIVPPVRLAPSQPVPGSVLVNASPQAPGAGPAVEPVAAPRGSVTQPGATPVEQLPPAASGPAPLNVAPPNSAPPNSALANSSLREGYPQYLRSARITQVATVALPGLAGLIALTAGGSVIGYRQANSGRRLRFEAERFLL
jgi:hypothetical protein